MQGSISRRNFLKGTAVGAGALAIGASGASILATPGKAHADTLVLPKPTTWNLNSTLARKSAWNYFFSGGG